MGSTNFITEKFDRRNDFGLWRVKMRALLIQQGTVAALNGEGSLPSTLSAIEKSHLMQKAHSAIILSLGDRVLRQVAKENTAAGVWARLESLYMNKSPANRLYLKKKLYTFQLHTGKPLEDHMDEFDKLILDLENIEVLLEDEDKAIILLSSLPQSYEHSIHSLMYGKETLTLEEVKAALNSKELEKTSRTQEEVSEALTIRGRPEKRDQKKRNASRSRSKVRRKCFICYSENHLKKACPEKGKRRTGLSVSIARFEKCRPFL